MSDTGTPDEKYQKPFLLPAEFAELLGITVQTVYNRLRRGEIPHMRIGSTYRIPRESLKLFYQPATKAVKMGREYKDLEDTPDT